MYFTQNNGIKDEDIYTEEELVRLRNRQDYESSLQLFETERDDIGWEISKLDIRVLTYLYLCLHSGKTQGDFATEIGSNPVALSRAINNSKVGNVKEQWIPGIYEMLARLDTDRFKGAFDAIADVSNRVKILRRRDKIINIVRSQYKFTEPDIDFFETGALHSPFGRTGSFSVDDFSTSTSWVFWDYDSSREICDPEIAENPFKLLDLVCGGEVSGSSKAIVFTTDRRTFNELSSRYSVLSVSDNKGAEIYRALLYIDIENGCVVKERIITKGST